MSFEYGSLPDAEKRRLCEDLLHQFGVRNLRPSGDELIHSCLLPFGLHKNGDQNPSASLNWKKLTYKCLGCGSGGGLLWFIATVKGESSTLNAREWLSGQSGVGGVQEISSLMAFLDSLTSPQVRVDPPMPRYDIRILDPWMLIHPYLTEWRHIPEENVVRHRVGWDGGNKIIIPHFWRGDLVGWQARRLANDGSPKYQSTPEFPRDRTIYNYSPGGRVVLVESPMSVVSKSHQEHIEATFGAAVTIRQLQQIVDHSEFVLFFDNDKAGWSATRAVGDYLMQRTSKVKVVDNPYTADPADLDDATYVSLVEDAVPYVLWSPPSSLLPWEREEVRIGTDPS